MALKLSAEEYLLLEARIEKPVDTKRAHLIAGPSFWLAQWLASAILLIIILSAVATLVTPSKSNPLNSNLFQQVTKPFLLQRERKYSVDRSNSSFPSGMNMKIKNNPIQAAVASSSSSLLTRNVQQKRPINGIPTNLAGPPKLFKATTTITRGPNNDGSSSSQVGLSESLNELGSATGPDPDYVRPDRLQQGGSRSVNGSDLNNNAPNMVPHDINNNTIQTGSSDSNESNRNVNSVNGTIDLSLYANSDVDRLYGDALLVYLKNFNETLPARKETINLNGTLVPTYRSSSRVARIPRWE